MGDAFEDEASELAHAAVQAVADLREGILRLRNLMALDSTATDPRDATSFAGYLAAALLDKGGRLPDGNPHKLRHPIAEQPMATRDPRGIGATRLLLITIVDCLAKGDTSTGPDVILEHVAETWPMHRNKAEAGRKQEEQRKREQEEMDRKAREDHAARLAKAKAPNAGPSPEPGRVLGQAAADKHFINDHEWIVGDDIGRGAPAVG